MNEPQGNENNYQHHILQGMRNIDQNWKIFVPKFCTQNMSCVAYIMIMKTE